MASQFDSLYLGSWVAMAYIISDISFKLVCGRMCDIFGRKPVLLTALIIFMIASALCGASWGIIPLIIFRAMQGAGGSALYSVAFIIVSDFVSFTYRGVYMSLLAGVYMVSFIVGPLLGGWIHRKVPTTLFLGRSHGLRVWELENCEV